MFACLYMFACVSVSACRCVSACVCVHVKACHRPSCIALVEGKVQYAGPGSGRSCREVLGLSNGACFWWRCACFGSFIYYWILMSFDVFFRDVFSLWWCWYLGFCCFLFIYFFCIRNPFCLLSGCSVLVSLLGLFVCVLFPLLFALKFAVVFIFSWRFWNSF